MKLSIVTINYNNQEGLIKTANSVLSQSLRDFEWILIDGGSSDGSAEFIVELAKRTEANISFWCSEPDKGIYNAMNKGILHAQGEYCLFLNSGDYFVNGDVLEKVFAIDFCEDVVYGFLGGGSGNSIQIMSSPQTVSLRTFIEGTIHHTGNAFIRRDAFDKWGLYDETLKIVSDWKWFLQAVGLSTATTRYIDIFLSIFDLNGISETQGALLEEERRKVLEELVPKRILSDYRNFGYFEKKLYQREIEIRSSASYRIGYTLLKPIKTVYLWIMNK